VTKYAILIYDDPAVYADMSPEAWRELVDAHSAFVKHVSDVGGSLMGGEALAPTTAATTIRGGGTVTDGPFVDTKEALGGFYVVEALDLDHALETAKLCPAPAAASRFARWWTRRRTRTDRVPRRLDRGGLAGGRGSLPRWRGQRVAPLCGGRPGHLVHRRSWPVARLPGGVVTRSEGWGWADRAPAPTQ
jgi:hypothetical protein